MNVKRELFFRREQRFKCIKISAMLFQNDEQIYYKEYSLLLLRTIGSNL